MSVKKIIQESLNANPLGLKEAFIAAIQGRIAEALRNKVTEFGLDEAHGVFRKGGSIGDKNTNEPIKIHDNAEDAKSHAKRLNASLSKGEKSYYGIKYHVKPVNEGFAVYEEVELDEAREESPVAGTKKIASFDGKGDHRAEVRKSEDGEFQVHHYNAGKHMGEGPVSYHGEGKEGKEDAMDTAKHAVNNMHIADGKLKMNEEVELEEAVKIGSRVKIHAPGKDYHGHIGSVGEIRKRSYGTNAPSYTVDYYKPDSDHRHSITLDKKQIKLHKEEVELDEGNADNKLKKNVFTAKLGHAADVTRSNIASPKLDKVSSRREFGNPNRDSLKNAVAKTLRAGRAELKHGKDAGFVQTLNDFGKNVRKEEVELDEGQYDDMIADFKAKGGKVTKGETKPRDANVSSIHKHRIYGTSMKAASIGARTTDPVNPTKKIKEEVEQIDEISKGLATAYTAKAKRTLRPLQNKLDMGLSNTKAMNMTNKRSTGIVKALDKLSGSAKINATEETEQE